MEFKLPLRPRDISGELREEMRRGKIPECDLFSLIKESAEHYQAGAENYPGKYPEWLSQLHCIILLFSWQPSLQDGHFNEYEGQPQKDAAAEKFTAVFEFLDNTCCFFHRIDRAVYFFK